MPSGPRIRANNVFGSVVNNPLTAGGTSLSSVELALLPEVSSAHAIITLDPLRANGEPEIVIVTAHGPGAQTATITRGTYGTVARQHPQGTVWVHAPLDEDVIEVATSASRPTDPYDGQIIYETDTTRFMGRIGGAWLGLIPPGVISGFGGSVAPVGWLLCDGSLVSTTTYADLFTVLGHEYNGGVDPGGGNFRLPDLRDRFPLGFGVAFNDLGGTGGSATSTALHTHTLANHLHNVGSHTHQHDHAHTISDPGHGHSTGGESGHTHGSGFSGFIVNVASTVGLNAPPDIPASGPSVNTAGSSGHTHGVNASSTGITQTANTANPSNTGSPQGSTNTGVSSPNTSDGSSVGATNGNMPPYQIIHYIVKY